MRRLCITQLKLTVILKDYLIELKREVEERLINDVAILFGILANSFPFQIEICEIISHAGDTT